MFAKERQEKILELLHRDKRVSNSELVEMFGVSGTTIRIDLKDLEEQGLISRTHGGALLVGDPVFGEDMIADRMSKNNDLKISIAKKAAEYVFDGDTILIDSGTTTLEFVKLIESRKNLTIVLNDLQLALELQKNTNFQLLFVGGKIRNSFECTVGAAASRFLREEISVEKAFMAANALSFVKGATTPNSDNAEIKRAMMEIATQKYLLCDSTKLGQRTACSYAKIDDFDGIFMDEHITEDQREELKKVNAHLL